MTTSTRRFLPIAKQLGGVWLVGSLGTLIGVHLMVIAVFTGGLALVVLVLAGMLAGGLAMLTVVARATAQASPMTADPDQRLPWALLVGGIGVLVVFLVFRMYWFTGLGTLLMGALAGVPFVLVAAVLAVVPRTGG
ncbi:hypothetical protein [Allokutzneria albata]|uniref:Uncharacterized protein n=1 Tax=Allokutzneria albata TaxID=211114 RepID=A0A1G9UAK5_ALLAB|nr:hypothetical protein [Allokutzneria albata]SDM56853.1 hypothetical protein SAMN04489726_2296 [Allokutzneria albata]